MILLNLLSCPRSSFQGYESNHEYFFKIDSLDEKDITGYFSSFIGSEQRRAFIAVYEGRIVGYITV